VATKHNNTKTEQYEILTFRKQWTFSVVTPYIRVTRLHRIPKLKMEAEDFLKRW